jgi:hypothetical protein
VSYLGRSSSYELAREKSAEAIVVIWKRAVSATEVSPDDEGLNVKFVPNVVRRLSQPYLKRNSDYS